MPLSMRDSNGHPNLSDIREPPIIEPLWEVRAHISKMLSSLHGCSTIKGSQIVQAPQKESVMFIVLVPSPVSMFVCVWGFAHQKEIGGPLLLLSEVPEINTHMAELKRDSTRWGLSKGSYIGHISKMSTCLVGTSPRRRYQRCVSGVKRRW